MQAAPPPGPRAPGVPRLRLVRHRAPRGGRARLRSRRRAARQSEGPRRLERLDRDDRARPHALGDTRRRSPRRTRIRSRAASRVEALDRPERHRRELPRAHGEPRRTTGTRSPPRPTPRPSRTSSSATTKAISSRPCGCAFNELEGHFAFVVIHHDHPGLLVGARHQVPLVVGIGARRDVPRVERGRVPARDAQRAVPGRRRDRGAAARRCDVPARGRNARSSTSPSSSTGTTRAPRRAASRPSCSRRSSSSPRPSPRRSAIAFATEPSSSRGSTCRARTSRSYAGSSSSPPARRTTHASSAAT